MRKVITVTFQCAHNYGAVLQAYALQKFIHDNFSDIETACLNYRPEFLEPKLFVKSPSESVARSSLHNIITFKSRFKRKRAFGRFINKYIKTIQFSNELDKENNVFIVGSDQVWNKDITNSVLDDVYCLKMINKAKKASYAASIGNADSCAHKLVASEIIQFSMVGVRELQSKSLLEQYGVNNISVNVDPVFLLEKTDYEKLAVKLINEDYILVYTLETNDEILYKVKHYKNKCKTVSIGTFKNIYRTDKHFSGLSPEEYLGLIQGAKYIITNSFHTIAFSIIFEKRFEYIPLKNGRGVRIENLISMFDTSKYVCDTSNAKKEVLEKQIKNSKEWINTIIEGKVIEKE